MCHLSLVTQLGNGCSSDLNPGPEPLWAARLCGGGQVLELLSRLLSLPLFHP